MLNWDAVNDDKLAYYETRTDDNVGKQSGLLEKTTVTSSIILPVTAQGKIFLYAVSKEGKVSNAATITYNKRRPDAPTDISLTKNNEGTLITFLEIPLDCIGANLYIDNSKWITLDNVYLYPDKSIKNIEIAYYDQFGEGERAFFSCEVPNVTGFWAEKNDANLYFYWDSIPIYNISYVVKVGQTHDWEQGLEIFRTKINKHRYIRPNEGACYYMIKAVDNHNNYSTDCAWYQVDTIPQINKNIVLDFDQEANGYSGNKVNLYLDSTMGGLRMEKSAFNSEYIMPIQLPQKIRARNWIDLKMNAVTGDSPRVIDCDFAVDSYEAKHILIVGTIGDLDGVELNKQIARYVGKSSDDVFNAITDGTVNATGGTINDNRNTIPADCRWNDGILITDITQLSYKVNIPETFSIGFWIKKDHPLSDMRMMELRGKKALYIGYDTCLEAFYVKDSENITLLSVQVQTSDRDWLYLGVSQSTNTRLFFVYALTYNDSQKVSDTIAPCGTFTDLYCHLKE